MEKNLSNMIKDQSISKDKYSCSNQDIFEIVDLNLKPNNAIEGCGCHCVSHCSCDCDRVTMAG